MKNSIVGVLYIALLVTACSDKDHDHDHDHDQEVMEPQAASLAHTIYSDKTELFVEFKPLIINEESRFAAHFTVLGDTFRPINEGNVELSLIGTDGSQSITADAPEVPGIFRLRLTPQKAGQYKLLFDIRTPAFTDQIIIDSVIVYTDEKSALDHQSDEDDSKGTTITYLKEQAWKIDFANQPVKRITFYDVVKTSGMVASAPGSEQTVASRTPGIVTFNNSNLMISSPVSAGQTLFSISSKGFTDGNTPLRLQEAKIALDKAKADHDRLQKLLVDQLTTQREFLHAKTEYESAHAFYNSLYGSYGKGGQSISAGQTGFVKALLVSPGQFVEAGQPLAVISRNNRLMVKAELSQTSFSKIGNIASANFRVNNNTVYSLEDLNGKVLAVGKFADNSLFIPIWFEIDNRAGIIPGTYIEVLVQTNSIDNALVIPASALMEEQGNYYCYVQTGGESFEKRELLLGGNDGKQVHVLSGISAGERVVTKGAYNIKLSAASGTLPAHGHEH